VFRNPFGVGPGLGIGLGLAVDIEHFSSSRVSQSALADRAGEQGIRRARDKYASMCRIVRGY
jgi:hypothetical protein